MVEGSIINNQSLKNERRSKWDDLWTPLHSILSLIRLENRVHWGGVERKGLCVMELPMFIQLLDGRTQTSNWFSLLTVLTPVPNDTSHVEDCWAQKTYQ